MLRPEDLLQNPPGPCFAVADALMTQKRGFDLGDDEVQLARLDALADEDDLTGYGWQRLGVLRWRSGAYETAAAAFDRAVDEDHERLASQVLALWSRLRGGEDVTAELYALAVELGEMEKEAKDDGVGLHHIRLAHADLTWLGGELDAARSAYEAEAGDDSGDAVWVEVARLRFAAGDHESASEAFAHAENDIGSGTVTMVLGALNELLRGNVDDAAKKLGWAFERDSSLREAARMDRCWTTRTEPAIAAILDPPAPDMSWLDTFEQLAPLRSATTLRDAGLTWLAEDDADEQTQQLTSTFSGDHYPMGTLWSDELWAAACELVVGKRVIARGPRHRDRDRIDHHALLLVDDDDPERLWLALSVEAAPLLWIPLACDIDDVVGALGVTCPRRVALAEQPVHLRAFMGFRSALVVPNPYSGTLDSAGFHELDRYYTVNPHVDTLCWGSGCDDDPWPDQIPAQPGYMLKIGAHSRTLRAQAEGGVCRFTRRSKCTRSFIGYELHRRNYYVWDLHLPASEYWPRVISRFNARFGTNYDERIPPDVLGGMIGFDYWTVDMLLEGLEGESDPGAQASFVTAIAAVGYQDLAIIDRLRPHTEHEDVAVRAALANVAIAFNWLALLEDLAIYEPDENIREEINRFLEAGIGAPEYDELGEPLGLDDDDEGEDDQ